MNTNARLHEITSVALTRTRTTPMTCGMPMAGGEGTPAMERTLAGTSTSSTPKKNVAYVNARMRVHIVVRELGFDQRGWMPSRLFFVHFRFPGRDRKGDAIPLQPLSFRYRL